MATQIMTAVAADATSSAQGSNDPYVTLHSYYVRGDFDGAVLAIGISEDGSAGSFRAVVNTTLDATNNTVNIEVAPSFYTAGILTGSSTSTSIDLFCAVGSYAR